MISHQWRVFLAAWTRSTSRAWLHWVLMRPFHQKFTRQQKTNRLLINTANCKQMQSPIFIQGVKMPLWAGAKRSKDDRCTQHIGGAGGEDVTVLMVPTTRRWVFESLSWWTDGEVKRKPCQLKLKRKWIFLGKTAVGPCHKRVRNRRRKTIAAYTLFSQYICKSTRKIDALYTAATTSTPQDYIPTVRADFPSKESIVTKASSYSQLILFKLKKHSLALFFRTIIRCLLTTIFITFVLATLNIGDDGDNSYAPMSPATAGPWGDDYERFIYR